MKTEPIVIERIFDAPIEKVWKAITDKKEMKKWYFDLAAFKPAVGFEFQFTGKGKSGDKEYVHLCEIKEVIAQKKLSYSWNYKGYKGSSLVTFELFSEGNLPAGQAGKTKLKLTHTGLETFPASDPDFAKQNFVEGWTYIIGTSLPDYLKNN